MLKALALHGMAKDLVQTIHAHTEYVHRGVRNVYDSSWTVSQTYDPDRAREWKDMGFLTRYQRMLSDDYRRNLDVDFV